jgi:hypothetical protein
VDRVTIVAWRTVPGTRELALVMAAGLLAAAVGCAKPLPKVVPEPPAPLEVPVPPPRVLSPVALPDQPIVIEPEPPDEPPRPVRPRPPAKPSAGEGRPEPAKTEPAAEMGPPVPTEPRAAEPSPPALRTPQTANDVESERRIKDVLARAATGLKAIDRAQLSADARAQFDTARRFIDQAADALRARNFMFAAYLADKAETLMRGLKGR